MAASSLTRGLCRTGATLLNLADLHCQNTLRHYARGVRRVPVNVLSPSSEEAPSSGRKSIIWEPEQIQFESPQKTNSSSEFFSKKLGKEGLDRRGSVGFKKNNSEVPNTRQKDMSTIGSTRSGKDHIEVKKLNVKNEAKSVKNKEQLVPIYTCGKHIKVEIINDKLVAERKLSVVMQMVKSSKARKASGKILLEGERLIRDAVEAGAEAEMIFFSNTDLLKSIPMTSKQPELYQVNHNAIQLWSEMTTSPGIIGIFKIPQPHLAAPPNSFPITLVCDNLRDPGNMGTVLRCAAAVGCKEVIAMKGCVDVWDSKVIRSAAGAHFRVSLSCNVEWDEVPNYLSKDAFVILADSSPTETSSVDEQLMLALLEAEKSSSSAVEVESDADGLVKKRDSTFRNKKLLDLYSRLPLPSSSYTDVKLEASQPVFLIVGGEAHGISAAARKLAHEFGGLKVHIPLQNGVESLNVGVAFGILSFEIRRQLLSC